MGILILTGAPGAGKSSVCSEVYETNKAVEYVNFGAFLSGYLKDGNDEKYCDAAFIDYLLNKKNDVIIDSHGVERRDYGIKFTPFKDIRKIPLKAFVLLKAAPEKILERRLQDAKLRTIESLQEIEEHQRLLEVELITNSCQMEVHGFVIYNNSTVHEATQKLEKILFEVGIGTC